MPPTLTNTTATNKTAETIKTLGKHALKRAIPTVQGMFTSSVIYRNHGRTTTTTTITTTSTQVSILTLTTRTTTASAEYNTNVGRHRLTVFHIHVPSHQPVVHRVELHHANALAAEKSPRSSLCWVTMLGSLGGHNFHLKRMTSGYGGTV